MQAVDQFCPNLDIVDTHNHPAPDYDGKLIKPDICIYTDKSGRAAMTPNDIKRVEIIGEFKYSENDDPFEDKVGKPFERNSNSAKDTLGQITQYATAQLAAQFRTHAFSLLVFRKYVRLLRWDRSGLVVTERTNIDDLCEFLWRFDQATAVARGVDTSINPNPQLTDEQKTDI